MSITIYGTPSDFQKSNRILVSTLAAYGGREVPRGFDWLKRSCDKFGVQLTVFGEYMMFVNMYETKLEWLGSQIWRLRNDYDYVISVDSADTLFLRELQVSDMQYKKMTFMAERNCFPIESFRSKFPDREGSTYKFLNAGGFCGSMVEVMKTFAWMRYKRSMLQDVPEFRSEGSAHTFNDDQASWSLEYLNGYVDIDYKCLLFQTLWGTQDKVDYEITDHSLLNKEFLSKCLILHGNGSADYSDIYRQIFEYGNVQ